MSEFLAPGTFPKRDRPSLSLASLAKLAPSLELGNHALLVAVADTRNRSVPLAMCSEYRAAVTERGIWTEELLSG
jgi:hypothetical protein